MNNRIVSGTTNPAQFYQSDKLTGVLIPMDNKKVHANYGPVLGKQINKAAYNSNFKSNMSLDGFEQGLMSINDKGKNIKSSSFAFTTDDGPISYIQTIPPNSFQYNPQQMANMMQNATGGYNYIPIAPPLPPGGFKLKPTLRHQPRSPIHSPVPPSIRSPNYSPGAHFIRSPDRFTPPPPRLDKSPLHSNQNPLFTPTQHQPPSPIMSPPVLAPTSATAKKSSNSTPGPKAHWLNP